MALVSFISFQLSCTCYFEALCCRSICFDFWHDNFLLYCAALQDLHPGSYCLNVFQLKPYSYFCLPVLLPFLL